MKRTLGEHLQRFTNLDKFDAGFEFWHTFALAPFRRSFVFEKIDITTFDTMYIVPPRAGAAYLMQSCPHRRLEVRGLRKPYPLLTTVSHL